MPKALARDILIRVSQPEAAADMAAQVAYWMVRGNVKMSVLQRVLGVSRQQTHKYVTGANKMVFPHGSTVDAALSAEDPGSAIKMFMLWAVLRWAVLMGHLPVAQPLSGEDGVRAVEDLAEILRREINVTAGIIKAGAAPVVRAYRPHRGMPCQTAE